MVIMSLVCYRLQFTYQGALFSGPIWQLSKLILGEATLLCSSRVTRRYKDRAAPSSQCCDFLPCITRFPLSFAKQIYPINSDYKSPTMHHAHSRQRFKMMRKFISGPVEKVIAHRADKGSGLKQRFWLAARSLTSQMTSWMWKRTSCTASSIRVPVKTE